MDRKSRKVFVMNNINSRYIEQAIFILKEKEDTKMNKAVISEAEKIVERYLAGTPEDKKSAAKSGTRFLFLIIPAIVFAAFVAFRLF